MPNRKIGPWTQVSTRTTYENPWISVREDTVVTPGGSDGIYGVVHFKNKAVGVIPIDSDGNTWLVGQHRYPMDIYSWEIPMGGCPEDTPVLDTARRELREETGLEADRYEQIVYTHLSNSVSDEEGFIFLATGLRMYDSAPEDTEDLTVRKLPLTEAIAMAMDGRITDGLSIAGLLRVALMQDVVAS
jgi:8-oxo-dGTP pyrophosphatase MutT (NUDIX family)